MQFFSSLAILLQVVLIDISLAADNAIVIGMVASGLDPAQRRKAVWLGLITAMGFRIFLAIFASRLMHVTGFMVIGGVLLLWISTKMFIEIRSAQRIQKGRRASVLEPKRPPKRLIPAVSQIILADLAMSLDNILAVAGAALDHPYILGVGLFLSIGLMGFAAEIASKLLQRWMWLNWCGVIVVFGVALRMLFLGGHDLLVRFVQ